VCSTNKLVAPRKKIIGDRKSEDSVCPGMIGEKRFFLWQMKMCDLEVTTWFFSIDSSELDSDFERVSTWENRQILNIFCQNWSFCTTPTKRCFRERERAGVSSKVSGGV
jgi:hypothetical protein